VEYCELLHLEILEKLHKIRGFSRSQYSSIFNSKVLFKTNRIFVSNDLIASSLR